jgi:hypothetical protein
MTCKDVWSRVFIYFDTLFSLEFSPHTKRLDPVEVKILSQREVG